MIRKHDHRKNKRTIEFATGKIKIIIFNQIKLLQIYLIIGESVTVAIPRIDHDSTDFPRLPGVVARISIEQAILKHTMVMLILNTHIINEKITLREAAEKMSNRLKI